MKIKNKLLIGFGLLFAVVLFFGAVSIYYVEEISENSKITLKNNYETLTFTREMRSVLDENDLPLSSGASEIFDKALKKQENNITEPGEKEATAGVRNSFILLTDPSLSLTQRQQGERKIRVQLKIIEGLNMKAIVQKNTVIGSTVTKATLYLEGMGVITFLILFVFIVNFPGFILKPLHQFTEGVQEISEKSYDARLEFKTNDEFAELAVAFNKMAAMLSEEENTSLTKIMSAELRVKTLMEEMQDVVLGINEKREVLFFNTAAKKILNLGEKSIIGKPVDELMKNNTLLKTVLENENPEDSIKICQDGKNSYFQQKNFEIVVPNLKPDPLDTIQFASYSAGMIYILKNVTEGQRLEVGD